MVGDSQSTDKQKFLFEGLAELLNPKHPLYRLANTYPWEKIEEEFKGFYSKTGRKAKPIRLMVSLLLLKQMYDLGDETVIEQWIQNPYFQYFGGEKEFQWQMPCDPSDLVHFRNRIGESGVKHLFTHSVEIHGKKAEERVVIADTTVQEKNITFPTDVKLYCKVIKTCRRIAEREGIVLRQRYTRIMKQLLLLQRFRKHPKNFGKARKAQRKLRTIAGRLCREMERKLSVDRMEKYAAKLAICDRVLKQRKKDHGKIYSIHEPDVYCMSKGKEHKEYEFGNKVSFLTTRNSGIVVGALSLAKNDYDGHTLDGTLQQYEELFKKKIEEVIVDRGYKGRQSINETIITMPRPLSARASSYQKRVMRLKFRRRASIEPVIGHLKSDVGLNRNYLKGITGDTLNALLAATAFNLRKWMRNIFCRIVAFVMNLLKVRCTKCCWA